MGVTVINTKQYLGQITRLNRQIQNKLTEIYQLRCMSTNASAPPAKNDKVMVSKNDDILGDIVGKIVDKEREVDKLVDSFIEKRDTIISQIDGIENDDMYHVLHLRYVAGKTFEEIRVSTNWSIRQVHRLHGNAISAFEKMYGDQYLGTKCH